MAELAATGLSAEQIALVMELAAVVAVEARPVEDHSAARRRERDRQYQADRRQSRQTSADTGDEAISPLPPLPPLKVSPNPIKKTPPISPIPIETAGAKKSHRLSEDWRPEMLNGKAAAMVRAWQTGEIERELAKFRNYWIAKSGKDACKADWQRTWINWLISADERRGRRNGTGNRDEHPLGKTGAAVASIIGGSSGIDY